MMQRLQVGVLDLVTKSPSNGLWGRLMNASFASIMTQSVAAWCEEAGHETRYVCYTGSEDLLAELPADSDVVFIGAFTQAAHLAYALSALFRQRGAVTVLGGPHARCYPEDAARYFDYVLGFTDKQLVAEVLKDRAPHRPAGVSLNARRQPVQLPGVRERWRYIEPLLAKSRGPRLVPMISSLGCPYTCSFCIDAEIEYQPFDPDQIREDLKFLLQKLERPRVAWYDPNFGVRFDEVLEAIEEAVPPGRISFAAESSLSLLSESRVQRLSRNGFEALLPGIESWYSLADKSKTGRSTGLDKVLQVSDHVNMLLRYVPYVQANFVLGLDCDEGPDPFELTKLFFDKTPGAFPAMSLLSSFGRAAPINLDLQRTGRVLPMPFHFLDNNSAMNVRPKNYPWPDFYDRVVDLRRHVFSWKAIGRRVRDNTSLMARVLNLVRAVSSEGFGRIRNDMELRRRFDSDVELRHFFEGESSALPAYYRNRVRSDLGAFWEMLPSGGLEHDPNAYLRGGATVGPVPRAGRMPQPGTAEAVV